MKKVFFAKFNGILRLHCRLLDRFVKGTLQCRLIEFNVILSFPNLQALSFQLFSLSFEHVHAVDLIKFNEIFDVNDVEK
jgi:hypothetical protein